MTSTNDGKEVKSYQTSGPKGKTYFIELYKTLEARLSETTVASERTKHLCEAWRRVHSLCQHSAVTAHSHLLSWLQRHTARTVLPVEWQLPERKEDHAHLEEAINVFIVESRSAAVIRDGSLPWEEQLVARGEWFKKILEHPWKHPVLSCLLNTEGTPPTDNEVLEWLKEERGVTFVMRLHTLVAEKCDDIAISLASAVMERVRSDTVTVSDIDQSDDHKEKPDKTSPNFGDKLREEAGFTVDIWDMLTDIEFVLLHKRDSTRCIALAKQTPLRSAYQLIERLQSRLETSPREKRLWKYSKEVAVLIAQVVIARCMVVPRCSGAGRSALYCCARSLARLTRPARLPAAAAALAAPAPTAQHLHTLAAAMDAQLAQKNETNMKPFVCELYVRAITAGMNELERLKLKTEKDTEARSMEATLANWFVQLGGVLSSSDRVKCECALTAFSVHPSPIMYERIKAAPALPPIYLDEQKPTEAIIPEFGSWASDSRGQSNFVKTSETLNMKARQNQANVLSTAILSEGEALGLSSELCQDIIVLLSGPRVKTLSWDMDRELLLENCRAYLERTHGGTKAVTTELKYLNLNPDDFQYLPEEEDEDENNIYYGIEKGYEHLVELKEPEDIWEDTYQDVRKSGSSYSSEEFDFVQPQRRRKPKKTVNADEDDPLSFAAETKRKEKKERPHSKERSKEKKKADPEKKTAEDPLEISEGSQEKKEKPKRVRKKKEKSSLSNLVGLKVGRKKAAKHTDSDANSQKSVSTYSDVVYDGTFSMDDMRSPSSLSAEVASIHSNGHMGTPYRPYRPQSVSGIRIASPSPSKSYSASEHSRNNSPTQISDEVKTSISKLLEYRRQKAMEHERKKPNAIIHPEGTRMDKINISPKAVAIPEIPKSYINKQSDNISPPKPNVDHLSHRIPNSAIPSPVIQYASKFSPEKPNQSHFGPSQYQGRMTPSDRCFSTPPSTDRFLDNVNLISIYDKNEPSHSRSSYKPPYSNVSRIEDNDRSHVNYQDYLHEYSLNSYNQYLGKNDAGKKVMRPASRVTPVVPHMKSETRTPQSAKHIPLKKPDGSLNTFSRLSYYKNKQTDLRKSQELPQPQPTVGSKLDGFIMNHLLQSDNTKPYANPSNDYQTSIKKHEKPQTNIRDHPVLANILQTNAARTTQEKAAVLVKAVPPEKDQNDLVLLLRQQKALNMHNTPVATPKTIPQNSQNSPIASGSKAITSTTNAVYDPNNRPTSPNVMSNQRSTEIGTPNDSTKTVNDRKVISVLSTSIIKTADQRTTNSKPKPSSKKPQTQGKPKKTDSKGPNNTKPVVRKNPEEWENVMDAILKQKTPYRGPKALEMTLNNSSFEKAYMDSLHNPTSLFVPPNKTPSIISRTDFDHEKLKKNNVATSSTSLKTPKKEKITLNSLDDPKQSVSKKSSRTKSAPTVAELLKQRSTEEKTVEKLMQQNQIHVTKRDSSGAEIKVPETRPKRDIVDPKPDQQWLIELTRSGAQHRAAMSKIQQSTVHQQSNNEYLQNIAKKNNITIAHSKQIEEEKPKKEAKIIGGVQIKHSQDSEPRQVDSFVSCIPNSDYDLLDELMDDDLRKEIGELSSDEESYNTTSQDYMKNTKTDEGRVNVVYNQSLENARKIPVSANTENPKVYKHQSLPQTFANVSTQQTLTNKEALKMTLKPSQNKATMPLNKNVQNATHVMTTPNNPSLLRSSQITVEPNVYIKATRPAAPNVMLIPSSLMYEEYPIQSVVQTVPNLTPNAFITVSNTPNISLYQASQFAAPVVNPVIIASAVTVPTVNMAPLASTVKPKLDTKVDLTPRYSNHELPQQSNFASAQGKVADVDKLDVKATSSGTNQPIEKDIQKLETKVPVDDNVGKTGERKVLKEVQEKHTDEKIEARRRIQKVIDKDIKIKTDQERVKRKRMAILNRKINYFCGIETIALSYSPLQLSTQKEENNKVADRKGDLILSNQINLQDQLREEIKSPATPDSYKENKSEPPRRILLRSSNKLKVKLNSPSTSPKPSIDKIHKGLLVNSGDTPNDTANGNKRSPESNNKSKRVSKRALIKPVPAPTDTEINIRKVASVTKTSKTPKKNERRRSNNLPNTSPNEDLETDNFNDFEAEFLGSTIPKITPVVSLDHHQISLEKSAEDPVKILENEETNNTTLVQEQQRRKDQSVNETKKPLELNECKTLDQSVTADLTANITDLPEANTAAENNFNEVGTSKITKENDSIVKDVTVEDTILKENQSITKPEHQDKSTSNDQQLDLDLDVVSEAPTTKIQVVHSTVNVTEKRNVSIATEAKDKIEHSAKDGFVHRSTSQDVVQPQVQKPATINIDDDDVQIVGYTPNNFNENLGLSKSFLDKVIIETITCNNNDPRVKTVRIKLPNGKSFKGIIRGTCSVANILENTKIKSHLVSLFQQKKKKYSMRLDVDKNNISILPMVPKEKPGPVEVVNLLSDDEDDKVTTQEIETEFGKHKIKAMNNDMFKKHQTRLKLKTFVPVVKLLKEEENTTRGRSKANKAIHKDIQSKTQTLPESIVLSDINAKLKLKKSASVVSQKNNKKKSILAAIPSKFVEGVLNDVENMLTPNKPSEEPIVLIDDSSNDSVTVKEKTKPQEKFNELKHMLLKDLGVVNLLSANNGSVISEANKLKNGPVIDLRDNSNMNETQEYRRIVKRLCFIKLVRCDDLAIKLKSQQNITINNKTDVNDDRSDVNDHLDNVHCDKVNEYYDKTNVIEEKADILDDKALVLDKKVYLHHDKAVINSDKANTCDKFDVYDAKMALNDDEANVSDVITDEDKYDVHDDGLDVYNAKVDNGVTADVNDSEADVNDNQAPVKDDTCKENDVIPATISRSSSFSILDDFPTADEENQKLTQLGRSSPVIEIYDLIASLKDKFPINRNMQDLSLNVKCDTEWTTTKKCELIQLKNIYTVQTEHQNDLCKLLEVPKLTTLLLSLIQKENLLQRYTSVKRLPNSLKRKSDPLTLPLSKVSKLVINPTESTRSDDRHSLTDLSVDASNVTIVDKNVDDVMFSAVTLKELKSEEKHIIEDIDKTPDLSDTDVTNVTISDCNDDVTSTETEIELEDNLDVEPNTHGNIPLDTVFDADVSTISQDDCVIFSTDKSTESLEKSKIDPYISDSVIKDADIPFKEKLQEPLVELSDDIPIDCSDLDGINQIEESSSEIISQEKVQDNVESIISSSKVTEIADEEIEVIKTCDVGDATDGQELVNDMAELKKSSVPSSINKICSKTCYQYDEHCKVTLNSATCEKTSLEENNDSFENLTNRTIEDQHSETCIEFLMNMNHGVLEPTNMLITKDIETDSVKTNVVNENASNYKIENIFAKEETHTRSNKTQIPKTNDEIVNALNKIFGESEGIAINRNDVENKISSPSNDGSKYPNNIEQNGTFDDDMESVKLITVLEKVQIDNKVANKINDRRYDTAEFPKTNDEIVDALTKMFEEPEDTKIIVVREVTTENCDSQNNISTMPNSENSVLNAKFDDVSLRKELMKDLIHDTVVEDNFNDITIATNTVDIKEIEVVDVGGNCVIVDCDAINNDTEESSDVLNILNQYRESNGKVEIKGIEYEDPVVGTHYVFSVIKEVSDINEQDCLLSELEDNIDDDGNREKTETFVLKIPKRTYANNLMIRKSFRNMKRKKDMSDMKTTERKYRKGKNIDYPKITASAIAELAYAKEYKRIIDYCSSIKFSYAIPFHINNINVDCMLKSWPLNKCPELEKTDYFNIEDILYKDTENNENAIAITDPLDQSLSDEILNGENISNYQSIDINETNFNKGFGEMSGRVIQKIETGFTKLSAATLSDVKQYQPFSMSEVRKAYPSIAHDMDTLKVKLSRSTNLISLKEKVRSFFKQTAVELNKEWLEDKKNTACQWHLSKFPFGLTSSEFMEVPSVESIVNVVQVGQLPVTAAAQNPVTCDPRVTHVSDASPSQCSDSSPGVDTQASVETEYTELTTANITLPIVQEYTQNRQQSPSQEQNSPENDDNMNGTSQTLSIVKIELMEEENSQEKLENELYDNDFSPLPNNNVEYSFEDTSNNLFNAAGNLENTASTVHTSKSNIFHTASGIDSTFTNIFNNSTNLSNSYMDTTPSSAESTYTNMDNASTSLYETSPNMGNSSNEMENTTNMSVTSPNGDTTNIDNASKNMDDTYTNTYNPVRNDSNDISNTSVGNIASTVNSENRRMDISRSSDMENSAYDYSYENIEDYATNMEHNNNADDYSRDVDNYAASVENFSSSVDDFTSNVDSYTTGVENFESNVENYATNIQNYSTNIDNYPANIEHTNANTENDPAASISEEPQDLSMTNSTQEPKICTKFEDNSASKINQIEHAMNAAGISSESVITSSADELANLIGQSTQATANNYTKSTPINVMTLQQALSQVLPPPLNQTSTSENQVPSNPVAQQVLHIVQGSNAQTVINKPNGTHLLHIVQNKSNPGNGLSLVDTGLQQGGNQLIHIVNNGNQNNAQFLKRVNLLTNLTNAQGSNEQKMIQFVCKSADGKSIQLNTGHQRSMVLRLHPTAVQTAPKPAEPQDVSGPTSAANSISNQDPSQDIKSRSMYEENYAQFIQGTGPTPGPSGSSISPCQEKATSLPKFNQVFGKQSYQENQSEMDHNGLQENTECTSKKNTSHLEQTADVANPPLLVRNTPPETTQAQPSSATQIKQTISPMNIHTTMHGGVIYTRQIPVNIGGGQTINLITVPSTELVDDSPQKQQNDGSFVNQESEPSSIIKLVPHHTANNSHTPQEENNTQAGRSNETNPTPQPPSQPVLTQMRIKLPMISKGPHLVPGTRIVRPSFFQIQRNVIPGTNPPVYQQVVLATAPPIGQTIRLPKPQSQPILVQTSHAQPHIPVQQVQHAPSSQHLTQQAHTAPPTPQPQPVPPELPKPDTEPDSELSTLTLEQLREFDMVLEQVKERSVQPTPSTTPKPKPVPADSTDGPSSASPSVSESTQQVMYSVDNNQPTNVVSYVNRKSTITSATTSFVRSPDSTGVTDTPSSSTQVQITHTVTSKSSTAEGGSTVPAPHPKKKKKKKPSSSSSTLSSLGSPSKTSALKPQEDEQTTQRILYILAEYKEQVENSPDKNKPAPRRRNQFPPTIGSKRKRSHCSSRALCRREGVDMSPMHGEHGELGDDSLITLGSEDSSCGTTFSECTDCQETNSPEDSTKVVRRLTFEQETTTTQITQTIPPRNVIVGDRQTITVARTTTATTAKPTTTVLMPANYLLPVSMLKGGQQIAIMTNRGPKILVGAGETNAGALLLQRLIGPGMKPVLARSGVRHIRLPTTSLHNLQGFNLQTTPVTQVQPPDSTAPQAPTPAPPDLVDTRAMSSPWPDREAQDKPERGPSPDCTEPWNLPSSSIADDYGYEEIVRTDNLERTVLDAIPDRYSPDMEAQRIFDKMFDVDSKKSMYDSSRCGYDIDTSDGDDKPFPQVVQQRKDGRHHRVTHVSTAALRHKYAILEHELRLQKSLSEECEDLGVDSPSASDLFPEADILFGAPSPAHEQTIDQCTTPPPFPIPQTVPQPDLDDQIATDHLLTQNGSRNDDLDLNLDDVGEIVTVGEDGIATIPTINAEEFARSHPNTTFHTEPEDGEIPPFTIAQSIKGRHITFHANRVPGTVVMAPQTTVISQATVNSNDHNTVKFINIDNMINSIPCPQPVVQSVLVKDSVTRPVSKFDSTKDSSTSKSSSKFDSLKEPSTSHKTTSKFDSLKDLGHSTHKSSSKFDSLKEPGTSHKSSSKFDSLKERSFSKFDSLKEGNLAPKPLSKFDSLLSDSKSHLSSTPGRQVVHTTGHGAQVIRRLRYDERNTRTNNRFHFEEPKRTSISDEVKMRNDRAMVESMGDNASSPGQPELFWESTNPERQERRFNFSESEKVAKSPFDELLNDSSAYGPHTRLDSVIKAARPERAIERTSFEGISVSGSSEETRPLRTYPPKRVHTQHTQDSERHFTLKTTTSTTHHHENKASHHDDRNKKTLPRCQESEGRRRTGRGLVKRGCSCCNGSSAPPKKRSRPKKPSPTDSVPTTKSDTLNLT